MLSDRPRDQLREKQKAVLLSYLQEMGLGEVPLADFLYLLRDGERDGRLLHRIDRDERPLERADGYHEGESGNGKRIRLYLAEEQQILREAFHSFFTSHSSIDMVGSSGNTSGESLVEAAQALKPEIMQIGVKTLQPATVEKLEMLREGCPDIGLVLLSASYDVKGIKALREFSRGASNGCAYLLKHTIDTVEQLTQVICSVADGRIILDPRVMEGMMADQDAHSAVLKDLSPRELEVLSWMAKGYRNDTIAQVLCLDLETVERHINSIYGKLGNSQSSQPPRVQAILSYLSGVGLMPVPHATSA